MDWLNSELVVVVAMAVLVLTVIVLAWLLAESIPRLHESVSDNTLYKMLSGMFPQFAGLAGDVLEEAEGAIARRTAQTTTPIDDRLAEVLAQVMQPVYARLEEIEQRQAFAEGRVPPDYNADPTMDTEPLRVADAVSTDPNTPLAGPESEK